ncbi:MAG TPA: MarR family transcriptional regulator [Chloroflexota bacterium]|nr:MarR family transcriptional regulator [Chloroflexota bacterium]
MNGPQEPVSQRDAGAAINRRDLIERFVALRPLLSRRMGTRQFPPDLRDELRSVTLHQIEALVQIYPNGLTMGALARALEISDGSAAVLADRLVRQGLAERLPDERDRRVVWLAPSERARSLIERFREGERGRIAAGLRVLDDARLAALVETLELVASDVAADQAGTHRPNEANGVERRCVD